MGKPPLPEDCPASLPASLSRPRNQRRGKPDPPPLASAADSGYKSGRKLSAFQAEKLKVFCPGKSSSSYRGACFSRFNQQTQPRPFAILPRQGFSWQDGSCATQLHPARGKSLWTPSCSALRFSHEKTREESCQCFRQWIQKRAGSAATPPPGGTVPRRYHRISETRSSFCPGKSSHLLPGPLVIYVSSGRQTEPR